MKKSQAVQKATTFMSKTGGPVFLVLMMLLLVLVNSPAAQSPSIGRAAEAPSDEELYSQLEAVILAQTQSPDAVDTKVEIPVQQDTYIASNKPNRNYGSDPNLRIGYNLHGNNDGALRFFLQFDVARYVPSQAIIKHAKLHINMIGTSPGQDASMTAIGRHLRTSWNEYQVTWNSHQPHWGGITGSAEIDDRPGWKEVDVTELVKEWHSGAHANDGIIVIGDERVQERQRIFDSLNANNGRYPRLVVDYSLSGDTTPPTAWIDALPERSQSSFVVSWSGYDEGGSGLAYFDVQYRLAGSAWVDWRMHTTARSAQWVGGVDGRLYRFRARAVDHAGNIQEWGPAQAETRVDAIPPTVSVDPLPGHTYTPQFSVSWSGSDNPGGSGIATYDVEYQKDHGTWQKWLVDTTLTSAQFTGAHDEGTYGFRARGIDAVGNVQGYSPVAQAATQVETTTPHSYVEPFKPIITQQDSFPVSWTGSTAPGHSIEYFDIRYQFNYGPWIDWLGHTQLTGETFTELNPQDGVYGFEARAKDSGGRLEPFTGIADAQIIVDRQPPFIVPRVFFPMVTGANLEPNH
jgi:hypothetical protein